MIKKLLYLLLALIIIIIILIAFFCYTNLGLRWLFDFAAGHLNNDLRASAIHGRLFGPIEIDGLRYKQNGTHVKVQHLDLDWSPVALFRGRIYVDHINLNNAYIKIPASSDTSKQEKTSKPFKLPIAFSLHKINIQNVTFQQADNKPIIVQSLKLDTYSLGETIHIKQLALQSLPYQLNLQGKVKVTSPFPVNLTGNFSNEVKTYDPIHGQFSLKGSLANKLTADITTKAPQAITLHAEIDKALQLGNININGSWRQFTWPLDEKNFITIQKGELQAHGSLKQFQYQLKTEIAGSNIPTSNWSLNGEGTQSSLVIKQLHGTLLDGQINGHLKLQWQPTLSWQADVSGSGLNLHEQWDIPKSNIGFSLNSHGQYQNVLQLNVELTRLFGRIGGFPLSGQADVNMQGQHIGVNKLSLALGNNTIYANGHLSDNSNLNWKIHLPQLSQFNSQIKGSALSDGQLTGNYSKPRVNAKMNINGVETPWLNIKSFAGSFDIDTSFEKASTAHIIGSGINYQNFHLKTISADVTGTMRQHQASLEVQGPHGTLYFQGHGSNIDNKLSETVTKFDLISKVFNNWHLNKPVYFTAQKQMMTLSDFCWRSPVSSICAGGTWYNKKPWQFSASLSHLNAKMFAMFFPPTLTINTDLNARLNMQGDNGKNLQGSLNVRLASATLNYDAEHTAKILRLGPSYLNSTLDKQGLKAQLYVNTRDQLFPINAQFSMPNYRGNGMPSDNQKIQGRVAANWRNLKDLASFVPLITKTQGQLNTQVQLSGTVGTPKLQGSIRLSNGSIDIKDYGLQLRAINIGINAASNGNINLSGRLRSGSGSLAIDGRTTTATMLTNATVKITGTNFQVINTHEYNVSVSPDLKITYDKPKLYIDGTIKIPSANITPEDFTSTTTLPDNFEVIRSADQIDDRSNLLTFINVNVILGDKINIKYQGFSSKLTGHLKINSAPEHVTTGIGQLYVRHGQYKAYGHELKIKRGEILFTGGPIDNPGLNIIAVKKINVYDFSGQSADNSIMAGVQITGDVNTPKIELYSIPSMPNSDILSYLLFGKSSSNLSGSNTALLGQAAAMLAGGETGGFVQGVQDKLGLSELGVESSDVYVPGEDGVQSNTSFVVGKRIGKRLEALYSVGFTIPVNILILRYKIWRNLMLQTNWSNYENSGDLFYTFEVK